MSTYYGFYIFAKDKKNNNELKYVGPYKKAKTSDYKSYEDSFSAGVAVTEEEKEIFVPAEIYNGSRYCVGQLVEDTFSSNYSVNRENALFEDGLPDELKNKNTYFFGEYGYTIDYSNLEAEVHNFIREGYLRKDILRRMALEGNQLDLDEILYDDGYMSQVEYAQATSEERRDFFFHMWPDYYSDSYKAHEITTIARNWFSENVEFKEEFKGIELEDLVFVVSCG